MTSPPSFAGPPRAGLKPMPKWEVELLKQPPPQWVVKKRVSRGEVVRGVPGETEKGKMDVKQDDNGYDNGDNKGASSNVAPLSKEFLDGLTSTMQGANVSWATLNKHYPENGLRFIYLNFAGRTNANINCATIPRLADDLCINKIISRVDYMAAYDFSFVQTAFRNKGDSSAGWDQAGNLLAALGGSVMHTHGKLCKEWPNTSEYNGILKGNKRKQYALVTEQRFLGFAIYGKGKQAQQSGDFAEATTMSGS
ncbi:hypothetical protein BX661DRAFT_200077 [Kickxella alabastrina]|uniref:uncharacterized protein n=1 Tax=Kickxella alabastrina TaxID=61397 RepID=UPI002220C386|nr:uncharacterized protein BX661DRAFT_200077 [Kickxella alabastrina]KAI7823740.1 hypothetical protein BX661DRAFT_200077 [Kickxella alabastrina]KAJ1934787.1 hypothetical protein GGF37_006240 [Kickxella alabastrina]